MPVIQTGAEPQRGPRQLACRHTPVSSEIQINAACRRGCDADLIRELAMQKGACANIPPKSNRGDPICFSHYLCRAGNRVERFFNRIKQCRQMATRYDKLAANYLAFVQLAISSPSSMHVERHDHSAAGQAALPIATFSVPTPSTPHSILSPGESAATPAGVPVMMMSPAPSATCCDSFAMISGTLQINSVRSPFCRSVPLTESQIFPLAGWPIFEAGCSAPQGAEWSNDLPTSHGRSFLRAASCRSRLVRSMPTP